MATERRRAATRDRRHHLELVEADMAGIGFVPRRSMVAQDIRDLQRWTRHDAVTPAAGPCGSSRVSAARDDRAGSRWRGSCWWRPARRARSYQPWHVRAK